MDQFPQQLGLCITNQRISLALSYASGTIFLYDYLLTFSDELKYMWRLKRVRAGTVLFFIARYGGFTSAMISFFPVNVGMGNIRTCFRLLTIVASDAVLAVRTWAIWERRKSILSLLLSTALGAIGTAVFIIEKDASTSKMARVMSPFLPDVCRYIESDETLTLALTLTRLLWWRKQIPASIRSSLLDAMWKDGIAYFVFMLVLSLVNIGLAYQVTVPQLRSGGSQLQTCLHSMVASRIIMSIAASSSGLTNIEDSRFTLEPIEFNSSTTRP